MAKHSNQHLIAYWISDEDYEQSVKSLKDAHNHGAESPSDYARRIYLNYLYHGKKENATPAIKGTRNILDISGVHNVVTYGLAVYRIGLQIVPNACHKDGTGPAKTHGIPLITV